MFQGNMAFHRRELSKSPHWVKRDCSRVFETLYVKGHNPIFLASSSPVLLGVWSQGWFHGYPHTRGAISSEDLDTHHVSSDASFVQEGAHGHLLAED